MTQRIVRLELDWQGEISATEFQTNGLLKLCEFGLRPLALFTRRPGMGRRAAEPSEADWETLVAIEQAVGGILGGCFTVDGYVGFFATRGKPKVRVMGKKVKEITRTVFRLEIEVHQNCY